MIDFSSVGAWLDQAGKDIDQGGQDFGDAVHYGAQVIGEALPGVAQVVGDVAQVVGETVQDGAQVVSEVVQDGAQVVYDVFNPANGPSGDAIVDQIESQIPNNSGPSSDAIVDQIESQIPNNSGPSGDGTVDQIESQIVQQSISDYVVGTDFNNSAPEFSSHVAETYDSVINPDPGLESSAFELSAMRAGVGFIDTAWGQLDYQTYLFIIESLQELAVSSGDYSLMRDPRIIQDLLFGLQPEQEFFGYVG
jgi:hypothetical protein